MTQDEILQKTAAHVREIFTGDPTGHDWWHIYRVWQTAIKIGTIEGADLFVVQLGALLHDIADFKFHGGSEEAGPQAARKWLESLDVDEPTIAAVCHIVEHVSFKGAGVKTGMQSLEGKVVQDADRLDVLGAIGIARIFAYFGHKGNVIYEPGIKPNPHETFEEYRRFDSPAINHFYEKPLLLLDLMNTVSGKEIAEKRLTFTRRYLDEFFLEWDGDDLPA